MGLSENGVFTTPKKVLSIGEMVINQWIIFRQIHSPPKAAQVWVAL